MTSPQNEEYDLTDSDFRLIKFARIVLEILEREKEWNADTIGEIGQAAYETGLSGLNKFGEFIALERKAKQ